MPESPSPSPSASRTPTALPSGSSLFLPLRLAPGDDLRQALMREGLAFAPQGCFLLSGMGSLQSPRLRFADQAEGTTLQGPFELLTLAGTITADGPHLHMSVADANGRVWGGHVVDGCLVRTTAEVLLSRPEGWVLSRELDAQTGFAELQVRGDRA